jgi:hypothetical protein
MSSPQRASTRTIATVTTATGDGAAQAADEDQV